MAEYIDREKLLERMKYYFEHTGEMPIILTGLRCEKSKTRLRKMWFR